MLHPCWQRLPERDAPEGAEWAVRLPSGQPPPNRSSNRGHLWARAEGQLLRGVLQRPHATLTARSPGEPPGQRRPGVDRAPPGFAHTLSDRSGCVIRVASARVRVPRPALASTRRTSRRSAPVHSRRFRRGGCCMAGHSGVWAGRVLALTEAGSTGRAGVFTRWVGGRFPVCLKVRLPVVFIAAHGKRVREAHRGSCCRSCRRARNTILLIVAGRP